MSTGPVEIKISNEEKKERHYRTENSSDSGKVRSQRCLVIRQYFFRRAPDHIDTAKEASERRSSKRERFERPVTPVSTLDLLKPVQFSLNADDGQFYTLLQKSIWDHLGTQLKLSGSKMNKYELHSSHEGKKHAKISTRAILDILQQCEAAVFTKAEFAQ